MDTKRLLKQALQYKPKGRRNIGRPRKRWRDQLHLEDQGTRNTSNPSGTWWWWWIRFLLGSHYLVFQTHGVSQTGFLGTCGPKFLCTQIIIRVRTLEADHSVTDSTRSFHRCFKPEAAWYSCPVSQSVNCWTQTVDVSSKTNRLSVSLMLADDILHVTYIKINKLRYLFSYLTYCRQVWVPQ